MTLCFVSDSYPIDRPFGGMAVYTQTAAQALARRGHECHVLIDRPGPPRDVMDGPVHLHTRPVRWLPFFGTIFPSLCESCCLAQALRALHRKHHFDLVEFPNWEGIPLVATMFNFVPIVVRLHTTMAESVEVQNRPARWGERFMIWAEKTSAQRARGVVTHSLAHRDRLAKSYGLDGIEVIPHGIDLPAPRPSGPTKPTVLTLGRLNARKGGPTLLAAILRIYAAAPETTFVIVGADEEHPLALQFRAAHPEIPRERVVFHRFLDGAELAAVYAAATVYASASIYESFGLTFVEAMARGIPVVGCATSAMNELIEPEMNGLLVPPSDPESFAGAVLRLLGDAALRQRFGARGREIVEKNYTADRMAADIERWYRQVLVR